MNQKLIDDIFVEIKEIALFLLTVGAFPVFIICLLSAIR